MTYKVSSGTLNLCSLTEYQCGWRWSSEICIVLDVHLFISKPDEADALLWKLPQKLHALYQVWFCITRCWLLGTAFFQTFILAEAHRGLFYPLFSDSLQFLFRSDELFGEFAGHSPGSVQDPHRPLPVSCEAHRDHFYSNPSAGTLWLIYDCYTPSAVPNPQSKFCLTAKNHFYSELIISVKKLFINNRLQPPVSIATTSVSKWSLHCFVENLFKKQSARFLQNWPSFMNVMVKHILVFLCPQCIMVLTHSPTTGR